MCFSSILEEKNQKLPVFIDTCATLPQQPSNIGTMDAIGGCSRRRRINEEKWFRIFDIPLYCKCEVYAPRKTTSMNYLRTRKRGADYSVFNSKGEQIGRSSWSIVGRTPILCYDTMKMIKSDDRSKLRQGGQRISQGTLVEKIQKQ